MYYWKGKARKSISLLFLERFCSVFPSSFQFQLIIGGLNEKLEQFCALTLSVSFAIENSANSFNYAHWSVEDEKNHWCCLIDQLKEIPSKQVYTAVSSTSQQTYIATCTDGNGLHSIPFHSPIVQNPRKSAKKTIVRREMRTNDSNCRCDPIPIRNWLIFENWRKFLRKLIEINFTNANMINLRIT